MDARRLAYKEIILRDIDEILKNMQAYSKVDATLSETTLLKVSGHIRSAKNALEAGFVKDACDEIEEEFKKN